MELVAAFWLGEGFNCSFSCGKLTKELVDWPNRKYDISGPNTSYAYPYDFFGPKPYHNITRDYPMDFQGLLTTKGQIRTTGDAMDTQGNGLCYKYA